jgi:hypothetical protein
VNLLVVIPVVVVLAVLRFLRVGLLAWVAAWWLALLVVFKWGFAPPIPQSAVTMYMGIATASLLAYALSSRERARAFSKPLLRLVVERRLTPWLGVTLVAIPALAAFDVYRRMTVPVEPPFFARSIHPSPPASITVHDTQIDLIRADNPFRHLKQSDPEEYRRRVEGGRQTYYKNCFYCHGDGLAGDGMFAHGLNPIPTNFTDAGILPNFQESFFFWRVSKGGPGMPDEGGPGDSAMPVWERFLSEEQIWEVVLFLYDFTGYPPRAVGQEHAAP